MPNGTEIAEGEMKCTCFQLCLENACFEFHLFLLLEFPSMEGSGLLLDWRIIIRKESTKYFIRQTKQVGREGGKNFKSI